MTDKIPNVPSKKPETDTPTVVDEHGNREPSPEKKMERAADRAAHKAAKTEQDYDDSHDKFTNVGPE